MSGHTPGRWLLSDDGGHIYSDCNSGDVIVCPGDIICLEPDADESSEMWRKANARLIAAAPEMLEALKQLVAMMDDCMSDLGCNPNAEDYVPGETDVELNPRGTYRLSQARAAIAKAEGRT